MAKHTTIKSKLEDFAEKYHNAKSMKQQRAIDEAVRIYAKLTEPSPLYTGMFVAYYELVKEKIRGVK